MTGEANENGDGYHNITLNGTIRQIVANAPDVGTVAIEMVSGTAQISYENGEITITSNGGVIKNVRLFRGAYTADNVPNYQPKGYNMELAECQWYFLTYDAETLFSGYISGGATGFYFCLDRCMRVIPTVTKSAKFILRTVSGYSSATPYDNPTSPKSVSARGANAPYVTLEWGKSLGTNNTPVVAEIVSGKLEFSADFPED